MTKWLIGCVVLSLAIGGAVAISQEKDKDKEELTIKDVMKKAHVGKPNLVTKVSGGKASDDDKKLLLELYTALGKNKPPKGDEEAWKKKTDALVEAAQAAVDGKKNAANLLKKASNCAACHGAHKPA